MLVARDEPLTQGTGGLWDRYLSETTQWEKEKGKGRGWESAYI